MRKICAITANRADFSRIETILEAIKGRSDIQLDLIVMGSHLLSKTGKTIEEIKRKGFKVNFTSYMEIGGGNPVAMTKSVGLAIVDLSTLLNQIKPDIVIVPVDRFESLAMGVTAALMNIHIAHIQGGEVTGTIDESIRHALTKMAHLHFVATEKSKERVIKMGEPSQTVFNVGCPGTDLLLKTPVWGKKATIEKVNEFIETTKAKKRLNLDEPYLLVVQHPVTTEFGTAAVQITETLEALKNFNEQVIVLWSNIDAGSDAYSKVFREYILFSSGHNMKIFKHLPTELYVNVLRNASCLMGNSSSGIREACYFGTPVVNIGSRQAGRERGSNVVDVDHNREEIVKAIEKQINNGKYPAEFVYGDGTAGKKIAEILATIKLPNIQKKITY